MSGGGWSWDPTLYAGSARSYPVGRVAYPPGVAERLTEALDLDGTGRLLDVGCGPGSLTLPAEVRASVYSLSSAAPHLFGTELDVFDAGLRDLLDQASPDGLFSERLRGITLSLWR